MVKVRATKRGYFGGRLRDPDDKDNEFNVPDSQFSESWMSALDPKWQPAEKTDDKPAAPTKKPAATAKNPNDKPA